ncbi:hypothetical protein LTR33_006765 [Friedmanniomyces endolithicus]|nr:hypothetical protein LTR33_006765 [Friedmanniomyces endolithicus]
MHEKFVLVFDGVDKQRESPPTLLPALARLGEYVPGLETIMIVQHPPPRFLHQSGVPYIHFPAYTRAQSIHILSRHPPDIFLELPTDVPDYDAEVHAEDKAWLWSRYCAAIWDSLAQNAARDLVSFRAICTKLWRPFVAPILAGDFGTRDFSRLLVAQRRLFQDETVLLDSIIASPTLAPPTATGQDKPSKSSAAYSGTKAAVLALHEGLQQECRSMHNAPEITFTIVHPTFAATPLIKSFETRLKADGVPILAPEVVTDAVVAQIMRCKGGQIILAGGMGWLAGIRGFPQWGQQVLMMTTDAGNRRAFAAQKTGDGVKG